LEPDDGVDDLVDVVLEADGGQRRLRCSSVGTAGFNLHRRPRSIRFRAVPDHIAGAVSALIRRGTMPERATRARPPFRNNIHHSRRICGPGGTAAGPAWRDMPRTQRLRMGSVHRLDRCGHCGVLSAANQTDAARRPEQVKQTSR
jgi:hypothetical protein